MTEDAIRQDFPPVAFAKAHLLREPLYPDAGAGWDALVREQAEVAGYFRQVGLELVLDASEGYAFLRQLEPAGEERVPRLVHRRKLSYDATMLLVCLRDELDRFDARTADQTRLVRSRRELHELVGGFLRESHNQVRDVKRLDASIEQLCALGFLRELRGEGENFQVSRIVKARFGPTELEIVRDKLLRHADAPPAR